MVVERKGKIADTENIFYGEGAWEIDGSFINKFNVD